MWIKGGASQGMIPKIDVEKDNFKGFYMVF